MPGGSREYVSSLRKCLEFVMEKNPRRDQLMAWFMKAFPLDGKDRAHRTVRDYVDTVKNLKLIAEENDKFFLCEVSRKFLETHDRFLLYQQLDTNYRGVSDIVELLCNQPLTLDEICSPLSRKIGRKWRRSTQCKMRVDWLQSLGYVIRDGKVYRLTKEGESIVERKGNVGESGVTIAEETRTHARIQEIIVELGEALGLYAEKEYPIDGELLDVVWKRKKDKSPSVAFEIELSRGLRKAISKLRSTWEGHNSKLFLVTTEKDKLKAESLVSSSFQELARRRDILTIVTVEEIDEWHVSGKKFSDIATVIGFRGAGLRFRRGKTSRAR